MLPILSHMLKAIRPGFHYVEDIAGDGALVGVGRHMETNEAKAVELIVAMRVIPEDEDADETQMEIGLVQLDLSPENARALALQLTSASITVDIEQEKDS